MAFVRKSEKKEDPPSKPTAKKKVGRPKGSPKPKKAKVATQKVMAAQEHVTAEPLYELIEDSLIGTTSATDFVSRIKTLEDTSGWGAAHEFALDTLQQLVLTNMPNDLCAIRLGVSLSTIKRWKAELRDREREYIKGLDPAYGIGVQVTQYREAQAAGWREAASAKAMEWSRRMRGVEVAMKATSEITKMMQLGGFFDNAPMRPAITYNEEGKGEADALKQLATSFLQGDFDPETTRKSIRSDERILEEEDVA